MTSLEDDEENKLFVVSLGDRISEISMSESQDLGPQESIPKCHRPMVVVHLETALPTPDTKQKRPKEQSL